MVFLHDMTNKKDYQLSLPFGVYIPSEANANCLQKTQMC